MPDTEHRKEWARKRYAANREKFRAYMKDYQRKARAANPEKHYRINLNMNLKRFYGITIEQYEARAAGQGGVCAICSQPPKRSVQGRKPMVGRRFAAARLVVDHDHQTGFIRGLLCNRCNSLLGFTEADGGVDKTLLHKAVAYLDASKAAQEPK